MEDTIFYRVGNSEIPDPVSEFIVAISKFNRMLTPGILSDFVKGRTDFEIPGFGNGFKLFFGSALQDYPVAFLR